MEREEHGEHLEGCCNHAGEWCCVCVCLCVYIQMSSAVCECVCVYMQMSSAVCMCVYMKMNRCKSTGTDPDWVGDEREAGAFVF